MFTDKFYKVAGDQLKKHSADEIQRAGMYRDALDKCGVPAEDAVFIDDSLENLAGAKRLGIMPVLIAANPTSDVKSPYLKIHCK